ncbi:MAG: hypothetical protein M1536_06020 [Firmicutes bacterium]|nr:hypothetical protein [Bacillota bacterium]
MNCRKDYKAPRDEWEALDCLEEIEPSAQFTAMVFERAKKEAVLRKPSGIFDAVFQLKVPAWAAVLVLILGITAALVFHNTFPTIPSYGSRVTQPFAADTGAPSAALQEDKDIAASFESVQYKSGLDMNGNHSFYNLIAADEAQNSDSYPDVLSVGLEFSLPSGADVLLESSKD